MLVWLRRFERRYCLLSQSESHVASDELQFGRVGWPLSSILSLQIPFLAKRTYPPDLSHVFRAATVYWNCFV
jgi:hypothetical protein